MKRLLHVLVATAKTLQSAPHPVSCSLIPRPLFPVLWVGKSGKKHSGHETEFADQQHADSPISKVFMQVKLPISCVTVQVWKQLSHPAAGPRRIHHFLPECANHLSIPTQYITRSRDQINATVHVDKKPEIV